MNGPVTGLTPTQRDCMRVIQEMIDGTGVCPSYSDLRRELGIASRSSAHALVGHLVDRGYLGRTVGLHRGLTILRRVPMPSFERPALAVAPNVAEAA